MTDGLGDPRRLAALAESGLLDSPPEAAFDRVTRLVAEVLHVPVALFTLVTDERQVFKSSVGVGELRETPLSHSFCRHVVESGAPLEVVDARLHPKVARQPVDRGLRDRRLPRRAADDLGRRAARRAVRDRPRAAPVDGPRPRRARGPRGRGDGRGRAAARQPRGRRGGGRAALRGHARHADAARQPARAARGPRAAAERAAAPRRSRCSTCTGCAASTTRTATRRATSCWRRLARRLESALVGDGHVYRLGGVQLCALLADDRRRGVAGRVRGLRRARARDEHAVGCRAATVELPREARSIAAVLRLADARLARYGHVATARA